MSRRKVIIVMKHPDWTQNPSLQNINPEKLQTLLSLAEQARGKNQSELLPFLMAASGKGNLKFSKDEMEAVISVLKIGKSPQEIRRIDRMYAIFKQKTKN